MKTFTSILLILLCTLSASANISTLSRTDEFSKENIYSESKIEVYYFHSTNRCATCLAVEDVTKTTLEKIYSDMIEDGELTFQSINLDEKESAEIAKKLKVSGQSLLIIKDKKKVDLTSKAFMYARTAPDKLEQEIKNTIDELITK